jgi:hypothetical protein
MRVLLDAGCEIRLRDEKGFDALDWCEMMLFEEGAKALEAELERRALAVVVDARGHVKKVDAPRL